MVSDPLLGFDGCLVDLELGIEIFEKFFEKKILKKKFLFFFRKKLFLFLSNFQNFNIANIPTEIWFLENILFLSFVMAELYTVNFNTESNTRPHPMHN